LTLRPYQEGAIEALYQYWRGGGGNPLVEMATGTGKSVVIGSVIRRLHEGKPSRRFLILTHVRELIEQDAKAILSVWPEAPVGINSAGLGERDYDASIVVAGIQSVFRNPEALGPRNLVVVDEAHLIPADGDGMYRTVLERLRAIVPEMRVAGFTATPYRLDSGRLDEGDDRLFDQVVYSYGLRDAVRDGWLARVRGRPTATEIDVRLVSRRGGEFVAGELERAADRDDVVEAACSELIERGADRNSWLCFCAGVQHAEHVRDALRQRGITAETVTGDTPRAERDRIFTEFRAGRIRALTGANVFTTGFDAPAVDLIAMLRPTLSTGLYVQMIGRGTRKAEGKIDCEVLDFAGNVRRHGPVDAVSVTVKGRKGDREEAVKPDTVRAKVCPDCNTYAPDAAPKCDACGYVWPRRAPRLKHTSRSEMVPLMSDEAMWLRVRATEFSPYRKKEPNSRPTLRAEYVCGGRRYCEFIPLEHGGAAWRRAEGWWQELGGQLPAPRSIAGAMKRRSELVPVAAIAVVPDGRWWRVVARQVRVGESRSRSSTSFRGAVETNKQTMR
jgi:DNA repair protein RadD